MHLTMISKERERLKVIHRMANNELPDSQRRNEFIYQRARRCIVYCCAIVVKVMPALFINSVGKPHHDAQSRTYAKLVADLFRQKYRDYGATLFAERIKYFQRYIVCLRK